MSRLCVGDSISSAVQTDDMGRWNRSLQAQGMDVQGDAVSRAQVHSSNFSPLNIGIKVCLHEGRKSVVLSTSLSLTWGD